MTSRYFCDNPITGDRSALTGPEAHHLISVMRARVGDRIVLFDGTGIECDASIASIGRREVQLKILSRRQVDREAAVQLTLAVALPKGDRQRVLVEKAVELGVARLTPIITQRSVVEIDDGGAERLRRFVIEASKQCGRNRLMVVESSITWSQLVSDAPASASRLIAHPVARPGGEEQTVLSTEYLALSTRLIAPDAKRESTPTFAAPIIAAIGPEGGFTDEEVAIAIAAGWQPVSLGPRILRTETAALAVAAKLL